MEADEEADVTGRTCLDADVGSCSTCRAWVWLARRRRTCRNLDSSKNNVRLKVGATGRWRTRGRILSDVSAETWREKRDDRVGLGEQVELAEREVGDLER